MVASHQARKSIERQNLSTLRQLWYLNHETQVAAILLLHQGQGLPGRTMYQQLMILCQDKGEPSLRSPELASNGVFLGTGPINAG